MPGVALFFCQIGEFRCHEFHLKTRDLGAGLGVGLGVDHFRPDCRRGMVPEQIRHSARCLDNFLSDFEAFQYTTPQANAGRSFFCGWFAEASKGRQRKTTRDAVCFLQKVT